MRLFDYPTPRVFSLPPSVPFLPTLAGGLWSALGDTGFDLADTVVLLPTRRAARALGEAFLAASGRNGILLPAIRTLGDVEGDDPALTGLDDGLTLPVAIDPLQRRFELARLVRARGRASGGDWSEDPVAALRAADELASLLDQAALSGGVDWGRLPGLVEETELAAHWQQSVAFMEIITRYWPARLAELQRVDSGERQRLALLGLVERWSVSPPDFPVVIAGSTGSVPAVRDLMACVARLPRGTVVLPGLDTGLRDTAWAHACRDDQHPQRSMAEVLRVVGMSREQVAAFPGTAELRFARLRRQILNEALTPAEATDDWRRRIMDIEQRDGSSAIAEGLDGLTLCEARTEEEEATAIALKLRRTLDTPGATAALVTPDKALAARVSAKLQRWDIHVDVSAGRPLNETRAGSFLLQVLEWALDPVEPVALCSLLKHPLLSLGRDRTRLRATAAALEVSVLRRPVRVQSLEGLIAAILESEARVRWRPAWQQHEAADLIAALAAAAQPMIELASEVHSIEALAVALAQTVDGLARRRDGTVSAWEGDDGIAVAGLVEELGQAGVGFGEIRLSDFARIVREVMAGRVVRPRGSHPRLSILGPLEARLLSFGHIIVAGLDENTWPAIPEADPFLSRPMRTALGLPLPEQRIGLQAHDFIQLAAARSVMITRSERRGDAPTVPSRWLWRLKTLTAGADCSLPPDPALEWARTVTPTVRAFDSGLARPEPRPPIEDRPKAFSATEIETWVRDPYAIYARKLLRLEALRGLGVPLGPAERGTAIHAAVERLIQEGNSGRTEDIEVRLSILLADDLAKAGFGGIALRGQLLRLRPAIRAFATWEAKRHANLRSSHLESRGETEILLANGSLKISARADRLDVLASGGVEIVDYKTGEPPSPKQVGAFLASQLPVTGLIVEDGGFTELGKRPVEALTYVRLGGRKAGPSAAGGSPGKGDGKTPNELIAEAREALRKLADQYEKPATPYLSKPRAQFAGRWGDYDHLARRAEWAAALDGPSEGEDA